jgi:8-oxo-dGTP pyrophosphatase MutT (NUDIX family)
MTGSSLLPATIHKGKIYFLFGKECEMEDSAKGFSDFGGGIEKGDPIYESALREGAEELTGFLGDANQLRKYIKTHKGTYNINHKNEYHVHIFFLPYDPNLPTYFNNNHYFLWKNMDKKYLNKTKLFEKIEIDWFSLEDIQKRRSEFRSFYQEITDHFLQEQSKIRSFLQKAAKKNTFFTKKRKSRIGSCKNRKSKKSNLKV